MPLCLGEADQFFQISKNQKSPPPKLSTVEKNDSPYRRQGHESEKEREISSLILTLSWRVVRSYSMEGRDFPFPYYGHQMPRSISFFRTWATPAASIWPDVSAEQRRVIVTLSWLNKISPLKFPLCDWRLQFHSLKCDRISSILFLFPVWCSLIFQPDFFKPKRKLVRNATRP